MDKKGISQALVDVVAALVIMLIIGLFFAAISAKNERLRADITGYIKDKGLTSILLTFLDTPTEHEGSEMKNADLIIKLADQDKLGSLSTNYFQDYSTRSGYCVEYLSIYKGVKKIYTGYTTGCKKTEDVLFADGSDIIPLDRGVVLLPDKSGNLYQIEAVGYWVGK